MQNGSKPSLALRCFVVAGLAAASAPAWAGPEGGDVVEGQATIETDGDVTTITTGDLTIIDWQSFNIAGHETVRFLQPGAASRVLNKILGAGPTQIDGTLLANGQVYIVNPAGVVFGANAVVNTGHLYAAAANMSNQDFLAGRDVFTGAQGVVENRGTISADLVALVGGRVANYGTITGRDAVVMAAGEHVMIGERMGSIYVKVEPVENPMPAAPTGEGPGLAAGDMYSIAAYNTGSIDGGSIHMDAGTSGSVRVEGSVAAAGDAGGDVNLRGGTVEIATSVSAEGTLYAEGDSVQISQRAPSGRRVRITADAVDLYARDGGDVSVGGELVTSGTIDGTDTGVRLTGGDIYVGGAVRTSNNGGMTVENSGTLEFGTAAQLRLDGAFTQSGEGDVLLGADVVTTGDDITFASDVYLTDDVIIRAFDSGNPGATPTISFAGTVDSFLGFAETRGTAGEAYFLSVDAGNGSVLFDSAIGLGSALSGLRARGETVTVRGDVTTRFQQQYIGQTVRFDPHEGGTLRLTSIDGDRPTGLERAQIEVRGDNLLGFDGNTVLGADLAITSAGIKGDDVVFMGTITSDAGERYALSVDAGEALAVFGGTVGAGAGSDRNLGHLTVSDASEAKFFGDIYTHGMTFGRIVEGDREGVVVEFNDRDTIVHTGDGVAWFGAEVVAGDLRFDDVVQDFVARGESSGVDVTFLFDGQPGVELGANRTPFKFTSDIGRRAFLDPVAGTAGGSTSGAFRTVRFGNDTDANLVASSFLFSSEALPGLALTPAGDFSPTSVYATDRIAFGRGQKLTSFGTLVLETSGGFGTAVLLGDVNVLGDFYAFADEIILQGRSGGAVEGVATEEDRLDGDPVALIGDFAAEIIVSGETVLSGDLMLDSGASDGSMLFLGAGPAGVEVLFGSIFDVVDPGTISEALFASLADGDSLYAYDLSLELLFDSEPLVANNLGLGLNGRDEFDPRYPDRYLPEQEVLAELGLNPHAMDTAVKLEEVRTGSELHRDTGEVVEASYDRPDGYSVTRDRLSREAVERLTLSYVTLLGEREEAGTTARVREEAVRTALAQAIAGGDEASAATVAAVEAVLARIDALELTPFEKSRAKARLLERVRPAGVSPEQLDRLLAQPGAVAAR